MVKNNTKQKNISGKILKITRDSGANVKILKAMENEGYIKIHDVMLENGRENKKVKNKILPVGVWDHARWDEAVWASSDCAYDEIRKIIGMNRVEDAMQIEAYIRNKHDYFVTEDNDFINKRDELNEKFGVKIVTPKELEKICRK